MTERRNPQYELSYLFSTEHLTRHDRATEYVRVLAVVIPKLEFIDVERKILTRDFMECADNAALHQRPEAFNGLRVNVAMHVFSGSVAYHAMRIIDANITIAFVIISRN